MTVVDNDNNSRQALFSSFAHQKMAPSSLQIPQDDDTRSPGRKQRASHSVVVTSTTTPSTSDPAASMSSTPAYQDVYSHPAAIAYSAAHPKRTIPKFGPYLLLQTLGEGEFGKVKLGLHSQWGEEVAVKLIRKVNVDSTVRMSKVEREIEVLRVCYFVIYFIHLLKYLIFS